MLRHCLVLYVHEYSLSQSLAVPSTRLDQSLASKRTYLSLCGEIQYTSFVSPPATFDPFLLGSTPSDRKATLSCLLLWLAAPPTSVSSTLRNTGTAYLGNCFLACVASPFQSKFFRCSGAMVRAAHPALPSYRGNLTPYTLASKTPGYLPIVSATSAVLTFSDFHRYVS